MGRSRTLGGVNVKAKRSNNERDLKKRENLEAKKRKRERGGERDEAKRAQRVKATCMAKTTRFNETMGTSGLRGTPVRSLGAPCVHGTPVFQSRDKDEARKGGLHKTREGGRGEERKKEGDGARERS